MFFHLGAQDMVFRQVENVDWKAGHAIPLLFDSNRARDELALSLPAYLVVLA